MERMNKKKGGIISSLKEAGIGDLLAANIKEELNKLFYLHPNYDAELEMLKYQYDNEEEERLGLHASSITTATKNFCFRKHLIDILYMEHVKKGRKIPEKMKIAFHHHSKRNSNNPIHLQRIFEEGKSVGTKWQRLFIRGGIAAKEDLDVSRWQDDYDLSYTPDGIVTLNNKKYVVEIKSSNKRQYEEIVAKGHKSGRKQLKLYMHFEDIERGFVLVDCKDSSDFAVFPVLNLNPSDRELADSLNLLDRIQLEKKKALKTHRLPPCRCNKCII
jgi:CRISPR/Cas system-associated exonuclease Cas4 (RecB family)